MSALLTRWPRNHAGATLQPFALDRLNTKLNQDSKRLFSSDYQACITFYDFEAAAHAFWSTKITSKDQLRRHLDRNSHPNAQNARCTFLFIQAPNSRDRLQITHEMLVMCCLQYDVMPELCHFLSSFGLREHKTDFHYSGFYQRLNQSSKPTPPSSSSTAPSCTSYDLCYNLKSVEESDSQDWSIRNCIVYHSFNLGIANSFFMMIKGDDLMQDRVKSATGPGCPPETSAYQTIEEAFRASLATHELCCDWSIEEWRWYINSYEDRFEYMTRRIQSTNIRVPTTPVADAKVFKLQSRSGTNKTVQSKRSIFSGRPSMLHEKMRTFSSRPENSGPAPPPRTYTNPDDGVVQPLPPEDSDDEFEPPPVPEETLSDDDPSNFSFGKLRKMHSIFESLKEAGLVLRHNSRIISQLKRHYQRLPGQSGFPRSLARNCKNDIARFADRLQTVIEDIDIQLLRLDSLCESIADRKDLLNSMLDWQNTQANKTANNTMVAMTQDMSNIARQTKIETVSMKVITLVTLAFLPGTFISVGYLLFLTLMSTDIFQSKEPGDHGSDPYAHLGPVSLYLVLTLPLTAVVITLWFLFHKWEKRAEDMKKFRHIADFFGA